MFPFSWQGETYTQCQPWVYGGQWETDGELWCSTKTDQSGQHIEGNFGICSDVCPVDISIFVSPPYCIQERLIVNANTYNTPGEDKQEELPQEKALKLIVYLLSHEMYQ